MSVYEIEQARVYRAGGRRYLTRDAAIRGYAKSRFREKHPCECEAPDYASGYPGYDCGVHGFRDRVLPRYVTLLRRCLKKQASSSTPQESK